MEFVQYRTGTDDVGRRLDKVLRILFPETPLSNFYSSIRKGLIRVNEKKIKQDYHISEGDVIFVAAFLDFPAADSVKKTDENRTDALKAAENVRNKDDIACIFRNEHIVILNKPYDMPVHETGSFKGMTLNQFVLKQYPAKDGSLSFTPGPLHRLDRKTTGLIAFSQSITGARTFTELLKMHEIKKYYLSVVEGKLDQELTFTDMLSKDTVSDKASFHTVKVTPAYTDNACTVPGNGQENEAKKAITRVRPLAYGAVKGKTLTLVEVAIETGRTHQIRSQCASHGYPLFGDTAYGGTRSEGFFLHAYRLEIPQPNALGLPKEVFAPLPERFTAFVEKFLPSYDISLYTISR